MNSLKHLHRNYFILIIAILMIVAVACYKFKLAYTISLYDEKSQLEEQVRNLDNSEERLQELKRMLGDTEKGKVSELDNDVVQQKLLADLTKISIEEHVGITGISEGSLNGSGKYSVTGFDVVLSGNYIDLVRALQNFEMSGNGFRIASVKFISKVNRTTRRKELNASLHIQYLSHA